MVKLQHIVFKPGKVEGVTNIEAAPKEIKLFVNKVHMGFDDCENFDATQEIEFSSNDFQQSTQDDNSVTADLQFVKFQRVTSLSIFVESNFGDDATMLGGIEIQGFPLLGTNMSELKKC